MRVLVLVLLGLLLAPPADAAPTNLVTAPLVTGYALDDLSNQVLDDQAPALTTVGIDGVTLRASGDSTGTPSAGAVRLAARAHHDGKRAELLVSNYSSRVGDFDPALAHRMLSDADRREAVASQLAGFVADDGFDGITVDLESLRTGDRDGLTAFVTALRDDLPSGATISIDLMAATSVQGYADRAYDLTGLAGEVDVLAVMAYDQHGPTWSGPGPIGSLSWQRKVLAALLTAVPASQVDLGVAGYGYTWPRHGTGTTISPRKARTIVADAGVRATWHAASAEWSATLRNGTRMWWSDRRSWNKRVSLATDQGLHGLALWRLGSADSIT